MKKLMIAAAVAAMTAGAYAGCGEEDPVAECQSVFTVSFKGKTATQYETKKAEYKTTQGISGKGYFIMADGYCYETFSAVKVGNKKITGLTIEGDVEKCTIFGKTLAKLDDESQVKPGKTYGLESDILFTGYDTEDYGIEVTQVGFGKAKVYITKGSEGGMRGCGEVPAVEDCLPVFTPVSYAGWFTGLFAPECLDEVAYEDCCNAFDEGDGAIFGGTWSAKFNAKLSVSGCED